MTFVVLCGNIIKLETMAMHTTNYAMPYLSPNLIENLYTYVFTFFFKEKKNMYYIYLFHSVKIWLYLAITEFEHEKC